MNEDHATFVSQLMDSVLKRLEFEVNNCPPQHLPALTAAIIALYDYRNHDINGQEKHHLEISLLNNINKQVKDFDKKE